MAGDGILLVEDNPDDEALTIRALRKHNVLNQVTVARDGAEAMECLFPGGGAEAGRYGLILLDLKLPKVDGLEVLRAVRSDERTRFTPIVILTSSREQEDILASYSGGANAYVRKPVSFAEFSSAVSTLGLFWLILNQPALRLPALRLPEPGLPAPGRWPQSPRGPAVPVEDPAWEPGREAAYRRATTTAPASAASTTSITHGSSTTRSDCAQPAARSSSVSAANAANAATPTPSQAARPAGLGSHRLCSGIPAFSGTRASAGSVRAAYQAAATMPSRKTPPTTSAATTGPSLQLSCLAR